VQKCLYRPRSRLAIMIHKQLISLSVCVCLSICVAYSVYLSFFSFCSYICLFRNSFLLISLYVFRINIPLALFYLKFKISATSNLKFKIINLKIALNRKTVRCSNEECTNTRMDREKNKDKASKNVLFLRTF
jgi:hypothetical protein